MKKNRILTILTSLLLVCSLLGMPLSALDGRRVTVIHNGTVYYEQRSLLVNGVTYVPFRDFFVKSEALSVSWNGSTRTASASGDGITVSAKSSDSYIVANGRYLYYAPNILRGGTMYIPLRTAAKALGGGVSWVTGAMTAKSSSGNAYITDGDGFYDQTDLYWLSRIISAESRGQSLYGMIAVGSVVLNRVDSSNYPDSVYDVIFDTKHGVQFTPVSNGTVYDEPTELSIIAAKICLDGYRVNGSIMYFINDALATNSWVADNCKYVMTIGDHDFYA